MVPLHQWHHLQRETVSRNVVLLSITAPSVNDRGPRFMQDVFAALHQSLNSGEVLELEYGAHQAQVGILCRLPSTETGRSPAVAEHCRSATASAARRGSCIPRRRRNTPKHHHVLPSKFFDLITDLVLGVPVHPADIGNPSFLISLDLIR
jgi:hypothetical protein